MFDRFRALKFGLCLMLHAASGTAAGAQQSSGSPMELVQKVIHAHGGMDRWRDVTKITVQLRASGIAFRLMGNGQEALLQRGVTVTVHREGYTVITPFLDEAHRGVFSARDDWVWIETLDGTVVSSRKDPRRHKVDRFRFDPLDTLYFGGYTFQTYFLHPFTLLEPGLKLRRLTPVAVGGERLDRLEVVYPEGSHTHSRRQVYSYGPDGLLRLQEYTAEVMGPLASLWAHAFTTSSSYRECDGIMFPLRRRAMPDRSAGTLLLFGPLEGMFRELVGPIITLQVDRIEVTREPVRPGRSP